jgi:hypothetical protein
MNDRELMQQAVEAMEYADACLKKQLTAKTKHEYAQDLLMTAGTALRERLAQPNEFNPDWDAMAVMVEEQQRMAKRIAELEAQPEQEPFGYFRYDLRLDAWVQNREGRPGTPFYTTPPQRKPLTDEQIDELSRTMIKSSKSVNWLCRAIEAAHGIKENT